MVKIGYENTGKFYNALGCEIKFYTGEGDNLCSACLIFTFDVEGVKLLASGVLQESEVQDFFDKHGVKEPQSLAMRDVQDYIRYLPFVHLMNVPKELDSK